MSQCAATDGVQIHGADGASDADHAGWADRDAENLQSVDDTNDLHQTLMAQFELGLRS